MIRFDPKDNRHDLDMGRGPQPRAVMGNTALHRQSASSVAVAVAPRARGSDPSGSWAGYGPRRQLGYMRKRERGRSGWAGSGVNSAQIQIEKKSLSNIRNPL
jgi:hypothetical protein